MAHVAEVSFVHTFCLISPQRVAAFYARIQLGVTTVFATSIADVLEELSLVRPTLFGSVPRYLCSIYYLIISNRIFEKAYGKIMSTRNELKGVKRYIFDWAESVGRSVVRHREQVSHR